MLYKKQSTFSRRSSIRAILTSFIFLAMAAATPSRALQIYGGHARREISTRPAKNAKAAPVPQPMLTYQEKLERAVAREAMRHKIDPLLIWALIEQESNGKASATSNKGARGVMQLMPGTAARWGVRDSRNVDDAVRGGTLYLVWLCDRFNGDVALGLAGYNAGEGAVDKYGRRIPPYRETQTYVRAIATRYARLKSEEKAKQQTTNAMRSIAAPVRAVAKAAATVATAPVAVITHIAVRLRTTNETKQ